MTDLPNPPAPVLGLTDTITYLGTTSLGLFLALGVGLAGYLLAKRLLVTGLIRVSRHTRMPWDDLLVEHHVAQRAAYFVPLLGIYTALPYTLGSNAEVLGVSRAALLIALVVLAVWTVMALLDALTAAYRRLDPRPDFAIGGPIQAAKLTAFLVGLVLVVSILLGRSPIYLLTGLGALSAVLMLIFKDPITGFVAGIQLSSNRMLAPGDWIEMPRYDADGDVLEVGLTTVKVQNFDQTVTTIPTYALVSESFKNWRGMQESGGRRIKRAISLDMHSIRFCDPALLERLSELDLPVGALAPPSDAPQAPETTNISAFRSYTEAYLRQHPRINASMSLVVRLLAPTEHGLPIEVYAFCKDKDWARYEAVQAEIFEHLLAMLPRFDLRVFQHGPPYAAGPSRGTDSAT